MSSEAQSGVKVCTACGQDCSGRPRTKDRHGRYFCQPCYDKAVARARARAGGTPPAPAKPRPQVKAAPPADDLLSSLADVERTSAAVEVPQTCAACGASMPTRTITCTACGHNVRTGQRAKVSAEQPAPARDRSGSGRGAGLASYLTNPLVIGLVQAVAVVSLFLAAKSSDDSAAVCIPILALYSLGIGIWTLVCAFREGVGTGFLCLCVPFYAFYFVYAKCKQPHLMASYAIAVLAMVLQTLAAPAAEVGEY